jgi:phospholipid N-methyltransferase
MVPTGLFMVAQFLRDHRIASLKATSPYLVRRICDRLDLSPGPRVVVEFGPGLGCFTRALLSRLSADSRLVVIETNPEFVTLLRRLRDPRLLVAPGSAESVKEILADAGLSKADAVISGIPFSYYPVASKLRLLEAVRDIISDAGLFLAYQASAQLEKCLKQVFPQVRVEREIFHIPPLVVLEARGRPKGRHQARGRKAG